MSESGALRFLGIAKKADKLKVGDDAVFIACDMGKARVIVTAADAAEAILRKIKYNIPPRTVHISSPFTKTELGAALGNKNVAIVAITEHGMAAAFVDKLAKEYPERYEQQRELLLRKAEKVRRRRHEKAVAKKSEQTSLKQRAKVISGKEENI